MAPVLKTGKLIASQVRILSLPPESFMKLYLIVKTSSSVIITDLLQKACAERGVEVVILDPATTNPLNVKIDSGDALYRITTMASPGAMGLETMLIRPDIATFRTEPTPLTVRRPGAITYEYLKVPAPRTVNYLPEDHKVLLDVAESLGGFPIIIKAMGGSHGVGVMRVDSPESLFSVADFVRKSGVDAVLKEYCNVTSTARLIVLGDRVISSIRYNAPQGDFRSNEGTTPNVEPYTFDDEVQKVAIHATKAEGVEFGGVDIMMTDDGPKVAEVNFPCYFPRCQLLTGDDIAGQMVDYLLEKSAKILARQAN